MTQRSGRLPRPDDIINAGGLQHGTLYTLAGGQFQKVARPDQQIIDDIQNVECQLSPENLTHDGELPPAQVAQKRKRLMAQRAGLIQELGREPTTTELYSK